MLVLVISSIALATGTNCHTRKLQVHQHYPWLGVLLLVFCRFGCWPFRSGFMKPVFFFCCSVSFVVGSLKDEPGRRVSE